MRYLTPALAAVLTILNASPTNADLGDQLFKLLADDGVASDRFGTSVAISGTIAIVGADWDDDNGGNSGSVYLYNTTTGRQIAKLLPEDGATSDHFGESVAIYGTTALVGAHNDDDNGMNSGSAYLFDTTTGQQTAKLIPSDGAANDIFGWVVAISGTTAVIGANKDNDNGTASGSAYLFDTITGQQIAKLLPDDGAVGDDFGISVAISGTTAIVGAYRDDDNGTNSGSAYIFDTTAGQQIAKLLPEDGAEEDRFGIAVGISGNIAIVGAYLDDDQAINSGSAYIFDTTTGQQIAKFVTNDAAVGDHFGNSIAISRTTAVIGANLDNDNGSNSGSAYIFDITYPMHPKQIFKLLPDDGAADDIFGGSIASNGIITIIGARHDDDNGSESGSAYIFNATNIVNCPWDLDDSGSVGTSDLLELFAQWGTDGPADFDESGSVSTGDLLILFANWGPCP